MAFSERKAVGLSPDDQRLFPLSAHVLDEKEAVFDCLATYVNFPCGPKQ